MPILTSPIDYTMASAGGAVTFNVNIPASIYNLNPDGGALVNLVSPLTFDPTGTPIEGMQYVFNYGGLMTYAGGTIEIFGRLLTAAEALTEYTITCTYTDGAWVIKFLFSDKSSINGSYLADETVTNAKLFGSITLAKLLASTRGYLIRAGVSGVWEAFNAVTSGNIIQGNGTDIVSNPVSGDATLDGTGVLTVANNAITTAKVIDGAITAAKLSSEAASDVKMIQVSFEATEQGEYRIPMPFAGTVVSVWTESVSPIAATDDGTIIIANNASVTMALTTPIVYVASSAFGLSYLTAVTANNTFVAGDYIRITPAKVTPGGKVNVALKIVRS